MGHRLMAVDPSSSQGILARQLVAALLRQGALPGSWTVYEHPVEQIAAPAAVVAPRSPYRERLTNQTELVNLQVALLLVRASDTSQIDELDWRMDQVQETLELDARIQTVVIAELGPAVNIGGTDHITGRLDITVYMDRIGGI